MENRNDEKLEELNETEEDNNSVDSQENINTTENVEKKVEDIENNEERTEASSGTEENIDVDESKSTIEFEDDKSNSDTVDDDDDSPSDDIAKKLGNIVGTWSKHKKDEGYRVGEEEKKSEFQKMMEEAAKAKEKSETEEKPSSFDNIVTGEDGFEDLDDEEEKKYDDKIDSIADFVSDKHKSIQKDKLSYDKRSVDDTINEKYRKVFGKLYDKLSSSEQKESLNILSDFAQSETDINAIVDGEKLPNSKMAASIETNVEKYTTLYDRYRKDPEQINITALKNFIKSLLDKIGANQDSSLLLLNLIIGDQQKDHLTAHSINVTIFSLIAAIHLSNMMLTKVNSPNFKPSIGNARFVARKVFTEEELIILGVITLIHDIYVKKIFPDIQPDDNLKFRDHLEYRRHPSEGYHMIKKLNIDKAIATAILQHHERYDAQGYPDGISEAVFNKYARILSFADRYELLSFPNPFVPAIGSGLALSRIIRKEKTGYDSDVILAFLRATSLYPLGSFVYTNTGHIAIIAKVNRSNLQKPYIKLLFDENYNEVKNTNLIDLNADNNYQIVKAIHPKDVKTITQETMQKFIEDPSAFDLD